MLNDIEKLKQTLDSKIVDLSYKKLNSKRFGYCLEDNAINKLNLLKDYQKLLSKILLQTSVVKPNESITIPVSVLNTVTNLYTVENKTVLTEYMGNCIKKINTTNPFYNTTTNAVDYTISTTYEQTFDCDNVQTNLPCINKIIEQIKSII